MGSIITMILIAILIILVLIIINRKLFSQIDYMLLLTFVCFFIISENLGQTDSIKVFLRDLLEKNTLLTAVGTSQIISNVPAALLLSGFTNDWNSLIIGTNLGGLGTLIASMASLISYKYIVRESSAVKKKYFLYFTGANVLFLAILMCLHGIICLI